MNEQQTKAIEEIQRIVVRLLATSPAGHGLCLIGGFRYRFLDQSVRKSRDLDYHWEGDLAAKEAELVSLFNRRLLPEVKRRLGYDGDVRAATGPESDSPSVRIVELAFWSSGAPAWPSSLPAFPFKPCHRPSVIIRQCAIPGLANTE